MAGVKETAVTKASPEVKYGDHYIKGKNGRKELKPDINYKTLTGHEYTTDSFGRIKEVNAKLTKNIAERNRYDQLIVGREDRLTTDEGGHLIASIFEGSGDLDNLVPMNSSLNKGDWKAMENTWSRALGSGKKVTVKINPIYKDTSLRPSSFKVEYRIDNGRWIPKSFIN